MATPKKTTKTAKKSAKPKSGAKKIPVRKVASPPKEASSKIEETPAPEPVLPAQSQAEEKTKSFSPDQSQEAPKSRLVSLYNLTKFRKESQDSQMPSEPEISQETEEEPVMPRPVSLYKKIAVIFIVLTVILLVAVFYFSFVKLEIVLIPNQERLSDTLNVEIYDQEIYKNETLPKDKILGAVEQVSMSETKTYSASGEEIIGEQVKGQVTIINNYTKNQPLVATTRLLSPDKKLFRIKETVNVPAGGSAVAEIYADEPGEDMAIGPAKFTIPGLWAGLQDKIYAQSQESFTYGQQVKKAIQKEDIDEAVKDIKKALAAKAEKEIGQNYKGYDRVISKINDDSIVLDVDGQVGEEKDKFEVNIEAKVDIIAFPSDKAYNLAINKLASVVPDNKELAGIDSENIVYELVGQDNAEAKASLSVDFSSSMTLKEDADIIDRQKIIGLTGQQLEDYLDGFKEIAGYEIKFSPSFINKVPSLADRIEIEVRK